MAQPTRRRIPRWRLASWALAFVIIVAAIVLLVLDVSFWLTVLDIGIVVLLVSNVAWLVVRNRNQQPPDSRR